MPSLAHWCRRPCKRHVKRCNLSIVSGLKTENSEGRHRSPTTDVLEEIYNIFTPSFIKYKFGKVLKVAVYKHDQNVRIYI